jgi:hypothetical protein
MKVKDAIRFLSHLPEDEEIVIAWWEWNASFRDICTKEEWNEAIISIEKWMDWSNDYEMIEYLIEDFKRNASE